MIAPMLDYSNFIKLLSCDNAYEELSVLLEPFRKKIDHILKAKSKEDISHRAKEVSSFLDLIIRCVGEYLQENPKLRKKIRGMLDESTNEADINIPKDQLESARKSLKLANKNIDEFTRLVKGTLKKRVTIYSYKAIFEMREINSMFCTLYSCYCVARKDCAHLPKIKMIVDLVEEHANKAEEFLKSMESEWDILTDPKTVEAMVQTDKWRKDPKNNPLNFCFLKEVCDELGIEI